MAAAIARAKANGKHVLLDFGGNWCPDCRVLGGVLELEEVKPAVAKTFEVAMIDARSVVIMTRECAEKPSDRQT